MKFNYKNICLAALAACSVTACDLDTAPTTSLEANAVFKNLENADRVIRGSWTISLTLVLLTHLSDIELS